MTTAWAPPSTATRNIFLANTDVEAVAYFGGLTELIHEVNPPAVTIAEDARRYARYVPALAHRRRGFDYRLAMGIPDFWIKTLKASDDAMGRPSVVA